MIRLFHAIKHYSLFLISNGTRFLTGQILVEILASIAIGGVFIIGATSAIVAVIRHDFENRGAQVASFFAYELLNKAGVMAESGWNNVASLNKGIANKYFIISSSDASHPVEGEEAMLFNDVGANLIAQWKFDEKGGDTLYDYSGEFINATAQNHSRQTSDNCKVGRCVYFSGTDGYANASWAPPPYVSSSTISVWAKTSVIGEETIFSVQKQGDSRDYFRLYFGSDGKINFVVGDETNSTTISTHDSYADGVWHFIVATYNADNGQSKIYVDRNQEANSGSVDSSNFGENLFIGSKDGSPPYFNGYVDDLRFYQSSLSEDEIKSLYNSPVYQRYFYLEDIGDSSKQKITATIDWFGGRNASFSTYLTRINDRVFEQAEWISQSDGISLTSTSSYRAKSNMNLGDNLVMTDTSTASFIESVIYDTQISAGAKINNIVWQGSKNNGQVNIDISYSNSIDSGWATTALYNASPDISESVNVGDYRYIRYKIEFPPTSGDSPVVNLVSINWSR